MQVAIHMYCMCIMYVHVKQLSSTVIAMCTKRCYRHIMKSRVKCRRPLTYFAKRLRYDNDNRRVILIITIRIQDDCDDDDAAPFPLIYSIIALLAR